MTSLQVDRNLPEITPAQSLTGWRREPRSGSPGRRGAAHPPYQGDLSAWVEYDRAAWERGAARSRSLG